MRPDTLRPPLAGLAPLEAPGRVVVVSDAWEPQVNGVVRTLQTTVAILEARGIEVLVVGPDRFRNFPMPGYSEIPLVPFPGRRLERIVADFGPESIHVSTEGPLGWATRRLCRRRGWAFTTSFHTQFPEYVKVRTGLPLSLTYGLLRRFHGAAARTMVATPTLERRLAGRGFGNLVRWARGVDVALFRPTDRRVFDFPGPVSLYFGRVAPEKNIEAFLKLDLPGTKVVVGDGPQRQKLQSAYPDVKFLGAKSGEELARHVASADVMVFPSRTDTFGLVMLEALACGVPVAAYPVQGPIDVVSNSAVAVLDEDLGRAARAALELSRPACRTFAMGHSWEACTDQFVCNLVPI